MERKSRKRLGKKTSVHIVKSVKACKSLCGINPKRTPRSKYKVSEKAVHNPVPGRDEKK